MDLRKIYIGKWGDNDERQADVSMETRKFCVVVINRANYDESSQLLQAIQEHHGLELQLVVGSSMLCAFWRGSQYCPGRWLFNSCARQFCGRGADSRNNGDQRGIGDY
jgi:hypothetical protein